MKFAISASLGSIFCLLSNGLCGENLTVTVYFKG